MYEDPYLKKRRAEEAEIQRQVDAKMKKVKDDFAAAYLPPEPYLGEFVPGPAGLFVPADMPTPDGWYAKPAPADYVSDQKIYGYPVYTTSAKNIKDALAYAAEKILYGTTTQVENSLLPVYNCPVCRGEVHPVANEHKILRGYHNKRYEYVWSETLKAHVCIGEPLKGT